LQGKGKNMDYDKDKVDELTLALLFLVVHDRQKGFGARAWKGFDRDTFSLLIIHSANLMASEEKYPDPSLK